MFIILDDKFDTMNQEYDIDYLKKKKYCNICKIFTKIKTVELSLFVKELDNCKLFCSHKTLQIYDRENNAIDRDENTKYRESLLRKVNQKNTQWIEFSGGLTTNRETKKIDRNLFYSNLKLFLDNYIKNKSIKIDILFYGINLKEINRDNTVGNLLEQIRKIEINKYHESESIIMGLSLLFPEKNAMEIIDNWNKKGCSKNKIIEEINNNI